jgi:hypothetical protein
MRNQPAIPAEIEREILFGSGHRCAARGTDTPPERAIHAGATTVRESPSCAGERSGFDSPPVSLR